MARAASRAPTPLGAALVLAGAVLAAAAAVVAVVVAIDLVPALAGLHNRWAVWAGTALHIWEPFVVLLPLLAVAALAYPTFAGRSRRGRARWNTAIWSGVLLVTAAVFAYVVYPFGFGRFSAWVLTAAVVAALAFVWARANWAVTRPLAGGYRKNLATYLAQSPRGETYFELLSALYRTERVTWFDAPQTDGDPDRLGRYRPKGDEGPGRLVRPLAWFRRQVRRRWFARLTRPMLPPMGPALAAHDPLLRDEVVYRRGVAWAEAEEALYGRRAAEALALEDRTRKRAAAAFREWLAATEALAECHLFNLPADGEAREKALRTAADLFAEAARRCLAPTLRGEHDKGKAVTQHWLAGAEGPTTARRFIALEIRCLELLLGVPEGPTSGWQQAHAFWEARAAASGGGGADLLAAARLLLAHMADRGAAQLADPRVAQADPPNVWPSMATAVRRGTVAAARAGLTGSAAAFALACRQRLLDAALSRRVPQVDILREEVREMSWTGWPAGPAAPWQVLDQWTAGLALLVAADQVGGMAREQTFRNALAHLRKTKHCALKYVLEALPEERWVQQAAGPVPSEAGPVGAAPEPVVPLAEMRARSGTEPFWFRRPTYFVRPWSYGLAAGVFLAALAAAGAFRAGPVVPAPDFRLGGEALNAPVTALAAGPGDDPALWVATKGDGVHVRAPGERHHWYRVGTADGLLSPDVYRVGVGERFAAFVCGQDERRGLSVAAAPAVAPGTSPWLGLTNWRTILGFSGFRRVSDDRVTAILQLPGSEILLVGTRGDGVGRYHVGERRWLESTVLDEAGGFLPPGHKAVTDLAAVKAGGDWHVWVATENGIAGGPIAGANGADPAKAAWTVVPGGKLLSPHVAQLAARETPDGTSVLYRTVRGGVGEVAVGGPAGTTHVVHAGEGAVAGLGEDTLRRAAYGAAGRRVWLADRAEGQAARFTVYREGTREMVLVGPAAGQQVVNDLVADRATGERAFAATAGGVFVLDDRAGQVSATKIDLPTNTVAALRVIPSAAHGIAAVTRDDKGGTAVVRRGLAAGAEWETVVGTRRVPGLALDGVTAVEPRTDSNGFFLGTRAHGVVFVDPDTREVTQFPTPESGPVRDLCIIPVLKKPLDKKDAPDKWLLRVTDDRRLVAIDLTTRGAAWKPLLNHTTGAVKPVELTAAKAYNGGLYLGSPTGLARYDIDAHRWINEPMVPDLSRLLTGAGALWAVGKDGGADALFRRDIVAGKWVSDVEKLKSAEGDDNWVTALDGKGAVWAAGKGQKLAPIFEAKALGSSATAPTVAAVVGGKLCVAPVAGGIGQYDPVTRKWTPIALLPTSAGMLKELRGTPAGLWAVDADGRVYLNPLAAAGGLTQWGNEPVATQAEQVYFADREAVVRRKDGSVVLVRAAAPAPPFVLVGEATMADLAGPVAAAAEFGGDLFVAAGERVVRYDTGNHAWRSTTLPGNKPVVEKLVATAGHLYAADAAGKLYRFSDVPNDKWADVTTKFTAHKDAARPQSTAKVVAVTSLGAGLGVVVPGVGVFVARDGNPDEPLCIQARSDGPPVTAEITSAAEIGGELYLGTTAHGLWAYADAMVGGKVLPPRWSNVALGGAAVAVLPVPADPNRLVVRTDGAVKLLARVRGDAWAVSRELHDKKALGATATADGAYVLTADAPPQLLFAPFAKGMVTETLLGPVSPLAGKGTRAVALDPVTGHLIRADADGRVMWSADPLAEWKPEAPTRIDTVFVAVGSAWAWSAAEKKLHRRVEKGWTTYPPGGKAAEVVQVVVDDKGVLVRLATGEVRLLGAAGADVVVRPAAAGGFTAAWKDVKRLAELGDWLLVGTADRGTLAYERTTHRWHEVGKEPVASFSPTGGDKMPTGFHVLGADGKVWHIAAGKDGTPARTGPIDVPDKVVRLTPAGPATLAVTDAGGVYRLGPKTAEALFRPGAIEAKEVPRVGAVAEWRDRLALGFADGTAGRVVLYDPARSSWESVAVPGGAVARFHPFGTAVPPRLVAEVEKTRVLVEIVPPVGNGPWTTKELLAGAADVAGAGGRLWAVKNEREVVEVAADGKLIPVGFRAGTAGALERDITAATPFGDEVIALLADKTLWHYSLDDLAWVERSAKLKIAHLVPDRGRLYAIEHETDKVHRYTPAEKGRPEWKLVAGATWDGEDVYGDEEKLPDAPPALWTLKAEGEGEKLEYQFAWKVPGDDKAAAQPVGFADKRFDFNRAAAVGHADGHVWVETKATADGKQVYRRFKVADGYPEAETGADRFKLGADAAKAALARPSSVALPAGELFRAAVAGPKDKAAPWPGRDAASGADVTFDLAVKVGEEFVPARPLAAGGKVRLDLDAPTTAVVRDKTLLLGTRGGLVRGEFDAGVFKRLGVTGPAATEVFPGSEKAWYARVAGDPVKYLLSDDDGKTWAELAGDNRVAAERIWTESTAIDGSNRDLANWRVVRAADGKTSLELKEAGEAAAFRPVALGPDGFDFDRLVGLELTLDAVRTYTPAGRIDLPRGPARPVDAIDPAWVVPAEFPNARAVTDPETKGIVLLADGTPPRALRRDGDKWVSLDGPTADKLVKALGRTHLDADGWKWDADESVRYAKAPFDAQPLRGKFDVAAGRFTFAAPRAVQTHDGAVWVATDAGVLTFRDRKLAGQELADAPAPGPDGAAAFVRAADGTWHLKVTPKGGAAVVFAFGKGWQTPPNPAPAEAAVKEGEGLLVHGATWQTTRAESNPEAGAARVFRRANGAGFVRVTLRPGAPTVWDFEDAAAVAGPVASPVIGTAGGFARVKDVADPSATGWDILSTEKAVKRLASEGNDIHALFEGGAEQVVGGAPLALLPAKPARTFEERDREYAAGGRWRVTKAGAGTKTEHRADAMAPWADAGFNRGRFAFDRALAVGHAGGFALLATPAGAVARDGGANGAMTVVDALPATKDGTAPRFDAGWQGAEKAYFRDGPAAFEHAGGKWQPLAGDAAAAAMKDADTFVARGKDWDVRRGGGLAFKFVDARGTESPASFDHKRGAFTFDFPTAAVPFTAKDGPSRVLVATEGGLWLYAAGGWVGLDADLDGDGKEDAVETLVPTLDRGPVARVKAGDAVSHRLLTQPNRQTIPEADATKHAAEARDKIDNEEKGWRVARAATGFNLNWWGEEVKLVPGPELRFKHDEVTAAEWHDGSLWVGTAAGVSEFGLAPDGSLARPQLRGHLWTTQFKAGTVAIRRVEGDRLVARAPAGVTEKAFAFAPADGTWAPLADDDKTDTAVVMNDPSRWVWRLRAPGRADAAVEVALDADRFRTTAAAYPVLAGGTFAFWDITPSAVSADVAGWEGDWFVGTAGGVLRIDSAGGLDQKVYARTVAGAPLTGVTHIGTDPRGGLYAKAGGQAFRYDAGKDGFEPVPDAAYPEHDRPVESAWMTWTTGPSGVSAKFKAGSTDAPPAGPLLVGGRFRFDDARQLAWRDGVWCHTPVGLVRSDAAGGGVTHHGKGLPPADTTAQLRATGAALTLLAADGRAYRSDAPGGAWAKADAGASAAAREVARNPLFVCRTAIGGGFEYALEIGDKPTLATGPDRPPVLQGGVFGFDDLRDVAVIGEELILSTRLGVWRHDPTSPTAHVPVGGAYHAAGGGDLTDLGTFVRGRPGEPPVLVSRDGRRAFARTGADVWEERPPVAAAATGQRDLGTDWRLRVADGGVMIERLRDGAVESSHAWTGPLAPGAIDDAVLTPGAIWLLREKGLLWVRTRRF